MKSKHGKSCTEEGMPVRKHCMQDPAYVMCSYFRRTVRWELPLNYAETSILSHIFHIISNHLLR